MLNLQQKKCWLLTSLDLFSGGAGTVSASCSMTLQQNFCWNQVKWRCCLQVNPLLSMLEQQQHDLWPWWSSTAGWSVWPHLEPLSHEPLRRCRAKAFWELCVCLWNLKTAETGTWEGAGDEIKLFVDSLVNCELNSALTIEWFVQLNPVLVHEVAVVFSVPEPRVSKQLSDPRM